MSSCECGCYKTYGSGKLDHTHSDWCPWSPLYVPAKHEFLCEAQTMWGTCLTKAAGWVWYINEDHKRYFCEQCLPGFLYAGRGIQEYGRL
jgi:hypothetical protein